MPHSVTNSRQDSRAQTTNLPDLVVIGTPLIVFLSTSIFSLPFIFQPPFLLHIFIISLNYLVFIFSKSHWQISSFRHYVAIPSCKSAGSQYSWLLCWQPQHSGLFDPNPTPVLCFFCTNSDPPSSKLPSYCNLDYLCRLNLDLFAPIIRIQWRSVLRSILQKSSPKWDHPMTPKSPLNLRISFLDSVVRRSIIRRGLLGRRYL